MSFALSAEQALSVVTRHWAGYWPDVDTHALAADVRARLEAALDAWELTDPVASDAGYVALTLRARRADGTLVVMKVSPAPPGAGFSDEAAALRHWTPTGACAALLQTRDEDHTLLLEALQPGDMLVCAGLSPEENLEVIGGLVRRLHAAGPAPESIGRLSEREFVPRVRARLAPSLQAELDELWAPRAADTVIHGDLHVRNVLSGERGWTVIDPHGMAADPHADIWALLDTETGPLADSSAHAWARVKTYATAAGLDIPRTARFVRLRCEVEVSAPAADEETAAWHAQLRRLSAALA